MLKGIIWVLFAATAVAQDEVDLVQRVLTEEVHEAADPAISKSSHKEAKKTSKRSSHLHKHKEDLPYCEDQMGSKCLEAGYWTCKGSGNVVCWNAGEGDCQDTMDTKDNGDCPNWYDGKCLDTCKANACEWDLIFDKSSCSIEWVSDSKTDDDPIRFDPSVSDDTCEDSVQDCYKACATACEKAGHEAFTWYQGGACSCGSSSCGTEDFPSASDDYHSISGAVGCVANGA